MLAWLCLELRPVLLYDGDGQQARFSLLLIYPIPRDSVRGVLLIHSVVQDQVLATLGLCHRMFLFELRE